MLYSPRIKFGRITIFKVCPVDLNKQGHCFTRKFKTYLRESSTWRCGLDQQEWNEYYENTDEVWAEPDSDLIAEVERLPAGRALDLGAGEGINSIWLAEQGWQVKAVDFSTYDGKAKAAFIIQNR